MGKNQIEKFNEYIAQGATSATATEINNKGGPEHANPFELNKALSELKASLGGADVKEGREDEDVATHEAGQAPQSEFSVEDVVVATFKTRANFGFKPEFLDGKTDLVNGFMSTNNKISNIRFFKPNRRPVLKVDFEDKSIPSIGLFLDKNASMDSEPGLMKINGMDVLQVPFTKIHKVTGDHLIDRNSIKSYLKAMDQSITAFRETDTRAEFVKAVEKENLNSPGTPEMTTDLIEEPTDFLSAADKKFIARRNKLITHHSRQGRVQILKSIKALLSGHLLQSASLALGGTRNLTKTRQYNQDIKEHMDKAAKAEEEYKKKKAEKERLALEEEENDQEEDN